MLVLYYKKLMFFVIFMIFISSNVFSLQNDKNYYLSLNISLSAELNNNSECTLIHPRIIASNENKIFIADLAVLEINIYNRLDKSFKTIGRIGSGPGEFRDITSMTINHKNKLVVVDYLNKRFSVFNSDGIFLKSYIIPNFIKWPRRIISTINNNYYLIAKHRTKNLIIHHFNSEFKYIRSFFELPIIKESNIKFEEAFFGVYPGNISVDSIGQLYYIPGFYNGKIYVYKNDELEKILLSKQKYKNSYEYKFVKRSYSDLDPLKYHIMRTNYEGTYFARRNYISGGLNILKDGTIANLLINCVGRKNKFSIEMYSADGSTHKYNVLMEKDLPFTIWSSSSGRWYLINWKDIPEVQEFILKSKFKK